MMTTFLNILGAIPESLSEMWYVYLIALLGVIVLSGFVLSFLKKSTDLVEAEKQIKKAKKSMKKNSSKNSATKKRNLISVRNRIKTAMYHYGRVLSENDRYDLGILVDNLQSYVDLIDERFAPEEGELLDDLINERHAKILEGLKEVPLETNKKHRG